MDGSSKLIPLTGGRIPSLDGLRALSIALVLLSHSVVDRSYSGHLLILTNAVVGNGGLGVSIFFVISGFLITTLLMREQERSGSISLRNFYRRRVFRIFPVFYFYIATLALLTITGVVFIRPIQFLWPSTFTQDYAPRVWLTGHTWSLSVEEQFYLIWPFLMAHCSRKTLRYISAAVIALDPLVRTIQLHLLPHKSYYFSGHTRADMLAFGCLTALLYDEPAFQRAVARTFSWVLPLFTLAFITAISPFIEYRLEWYRLGIFYKPLVGYSAEGICIVLLLLYAIQNTQSWTGRVLNNRAIVHIGVLSYSIYMWQGVFIGHPVWATPVWLGIPLCFVAGQISYTFIEKPVLNLRKKFERKDSREVPVLASSAN